MSANFAEYKFVWQRFFSFQQPRTETRHRLSIYYEQRARNCKAWRERSCYCEWIDIADHILRFYKYAFYMRLSNRDLRIGSSATTSPNYDNIPRYSWFNIKCKLARFRCTLGSEQSLPRIIFVEYNAHTFFAKFTNNWNTWRIVKYSKITSSYFARFIARN